MRGLFWFFVVLGLLYSLDLATAVEGNGVITLDVTSDISIQQTNQPQFLPMLIRIVQVENNTEKTIWKSLINKSEDLNIPVPHGNYKVYFQLQGHKTIWELNNGNYYTVSSSEPVVVPLWANTPFSDVLADAPWRVNLKTTTPILLMVKDADQSSINLNHVKIWTGYWYTFESNTGNFGNVVDMSVK